MSNIEKIIREYFYNAAGSKLEDRDHVGELFDHDSNWGFDPRELAGLILAEHLALLDKYISIYRDGNSPLNKHSADALRILREEMARDMEVARKERVLAEHSGCGHGIQVDQITVRLNPGDRVLLVSK